MTKTEAQTAEAEKRKAPRKEPHKNRAEDAELEEALEESFPASDPPSMTQPKNEIGAPEKRRKPQRDRQ
jgi:hypothetical protein